MYNYLDVDYFKDIYMKIKEGATFEDICKAYSGISLNLPVSLKSVERQKIFEEVLVLREKGHSYNSLCVKFGVPSYVLRKWVKQGYWSG